MKSRPHLRPGDKNPGKTLRRLEAEIELRQAKVAALKAGVPAAEEPAEEPRDDALNRLVVKYFWTQMGKTTDPAEWVGRGGVAGMVRLRMGAGAPKADSVVRTLKRLVEDDDDDVSLRTPSGSAMPRIFSDEDDMYAALLIVEGHSQRSATFLINGDRSAAGLGPISKHVIQDAEARVGLLRRRRRNEKSGSSDLSCAWAVASLALAQQLRLQLRAGAELARRPTAGPVLKVGAKPVACLPTDIWQLLGETLQFMGAWFAGVTPAQRKQKWPCTLIAYTDTYKWGLGDVAPTYVMESLNEGARRYPVRASTVWDMLTRKKQAEIEAAAEARAAAPPPFVTEQLLVVDQHHKQCRLGKASEFDCKLPEKDGQWCSPDDGGEYPEWSNRKTVKHAKEVRMHLGVMMKRGEDGELRGYKMEPLEYTDKWVVGVKRIAQEVKAVVDKTNRLQGGGTWGCTKDYTQAQLAELEGGRWEAWYIEKYGSGDGWREAVLKKVGSGDHALICVTNLMQHTIDQGNKLFHGTQYADTWLINSDRLATWWEKEAQDYLRERGFFDRQVRAWGDTNADFWRYFQSVVGDRPELCALDFHLFEDLDYSIGQNIINTSWLPVGDPRRYDDGTPAQLSSAMRRTWADNPTGARIVEDISRYPLIIDKIIEYKGGVVPDFAAQRNGCSKRKRKASEACRLYTPSAEVEALAATRRKQLRLKAQEMCSPEC